MRAVADFADRVPDAWREKDSFFNPMCQREALWSGFCAAVWKPGPPAGFPDQKTSGTEDGWTINVVSNRALEFRPSMCTGRVRRLETN